MSVILGIDIGGSTTKIVGAAPRRLHHRHAPGSRPRTPSLPSTAPLGNFLFTNGLALSDVSRIVLTGVGASYVEGDIYGIPTEKVEEFTAVGVGGLALSGQEKAVVVKPWAPAPPLSGAERGKEVRHLCGSGVGGGTLAGLCSRLCGTRQYDQIVKLALEGDVNHIDLTVGDITRNSHPLPAPGHHCRQLRQHLR